MKLPPKYQAKTEWIAPTEYPDLSKYNEIAIDLETRDPDLKKLGSGVNRNNGEIIGISVAVEGWQRYYPIAHGQGPNLERKKVLGWFQDVLNTPADKIFHNAMYDVSWIRATGLKINGRIYDTMIAASLVDENRFSYTLNSLAGFYKLGYKDETELTRAAKERGLDPKSEMWKLPAMSVGTYAEKDAELTLSLWKLLKQKISEEKEEGRNLQQIFNLETDLFPCLVDMKFLGVRVDVETANELKHKLSLQEEMLLQRIKKESNIDVQIWAARSIAKVFDNIGESYELTEKTEAPSFTKNFITNHNHPVVRMIAEARKINKIRTTFIDTILNHEYGGRIHADINQIRSDDGGTVTGRFSYSNPNLQQIPARDPDTGPLIRSLFIPEKGCKWGCFDYSQQEPRLVTHYALQFKLGSVKTIAEAYENDPSTDFHKIVAEMAEIPRSQAKTINLGLFYGMGKAKLQAELGVSKETAEELFSQYHTRVPFVKRLMNEVMKFAQDNGHLRTIEKRFCRFPKYEPILRGDDWGKYVPAEDHERMLELQTMGPWLKDEDDEYILNEKGEKKKNYWHNNGSRRAFTYKALNRLIQGSAADMTKKAMLHLYQQGIIPHIQIHDELDFSIESDMQADKIKQIMEHAVELKVPNKVDYESGPNWGEIK